jgi:predicted MFS family arabinose efflux permease
MARNIGRSAPAPRARRRVYFGWRVVAALFMCVSSLIGVAMYAFIMFAEPLAHEFGWSSSQTGALVSAMWLAGPVALVAAPLIERLGAWRLLMLGMTVQVVTLAGLGSISAFWQLYLLRIAMGVGKVLVMTCVPVIVARWFDRRFATAMAIAWAGSGAGGVLMAPLTQALASAFGWKLAALVLSAALAGSMALTALLARGAATPAVLGLRRDGGVASLGLGGEEAAIPIIAHEAERTGTPLRWTEVLGAMNWTTAAFMCLAVVGAGMFSIGLQSQEPALLHKSGLAPDLAAALLGLTAAAGLAGSVVTGWLLDRVHVLWSALSVGICITLGLLGFWLLSGSGAVLLAAAAAAAVGYGIGAGEVVWITLFKRQFGDAAFATTYGIFYFSLQVGLASGGFIGGWSLDHLGADGLLLMAALIYAPAAVFCIWRPGGRQLVSPP